ncbi:MAG TPA: RDD family protein [Mucilaginibacter sp.]|nr:RDD family protein [Mucilaginibacter sp.]
MQSEYFVVINGKPEGPFDLEGLKGVGLKPSDFIKTPEMPDYKEAHELAELRQLFHFAKRTVMPQYFAGLDQRLLASALDWFIISGVCIVPALLVVLFIPGQVVAIMVGISLLVVIPLVNFVYHIVMECSPKQATYGKQILKISVCDMGGNPIGAGQAIGRNICKLLSDFTFSIGYLISFFNKKQQCLHDMIAGTLVVKERLF